MKTKYYIEYKFYGNSGCYTITKRMLWFFTTTVEKCESEAHAKQRLSEIEKR